MANLCNMTYNYAGMAEDRIVIVFSGPYNFRF